MCGKMGNNEVESIQNIMSMAVYWVIADVFEIDTDQLNPQSNLRADFNMTTEIQHRLNESIREMFNDVCVDFSRVETVQDIVEQVACITIH